MLMTTASLLLNKGRPLNEGARHNERSAGGLTWAPTHKKQQDWGPLPTQKTPLKPPALLQNQLSFNNKGAEHCEHYALGITEASIQTI